MITIETFLKWHAQATKQEDGLRLTFPIPVHADLAPRLNNQSLKSIECWWRVTRSGLIIGMLNNSTDYRLSDFKNYKQTKVTNAVNLSFTMTMLGKLLIEPK